MPAAASEPSTQSGADRAAGGPPCVLLAHVSDVHFGAEEPTVVLALQTALTALAPDLVVVSGDLTQRARRRQFGTAAAWLAALPAPHVVIPGNHDVPLYDIPRRVLAPVGRYHRMITDVRTPAAALPGVRVLGLDSTRRKTTGRLTAARIAAIARLSDGPPGDLRVLTVHHPLVEGQTAGFAPALRAAVAAHVDVVCSGHTHLTRIVTQAVDAHAGVVASGAGTATSFRTRKREPSNAFNLLRWDGAGHLDIEHWRAVRGPFARHRVRAYERGTDGRWRDTLIEGARSD